MSDKTRILLCDDHTILRTGLKMLIGAADAQKGVGEAGGGGEAWMTPTLRPTSWAASSGSRSNLPSANR